MIQGTAPSINFPPISLADGFMPRDTGDVCRAVRDTWHVTVLTGQIISGICRLKWNISVNASHWPAKHFLQHSIIACYMLPREVNLDICKYATLVYISLCREAGLSPVLEAKFLLRDGRKKANMYLPNFWPNLASVCLDVCICINMILLTRIFLTPDY